MEPRPLSPSELTDARNAADFRMSQSDWQADLILDLQRRHPLRMARVMKDLAWLRKQARRRGHRWAGDDA